VNAPTISGKGWPSMSPADLAVSLLPFFAGWTIAACPYDSAHWCDLVRKDGATMRVYAGPAGWVPDGRVEIAGVFPRTKDGQSVVGWRESTPKITCSIARGPKTIAAEITRRLLPAYLARFDHLKSVVEQKDSTSDEADVVASRLVAQLGEGASTSRERSYTGDTRKIWAKLEGVYRLGVRPASDGVCVDMELHGVAPETAAAVLAIIQEAEARAHAAPMRVEQTVSREAVDDAEEETATAPLRRVVV